MKMSFIKGDGDWDEVLRMEIWKSLILVMMAGGWEIDFFFFVYVCGLWIMGRGMLVWISWIWLVLKDVSMNVFELG